MSKNERLQLRSTNIPDMSVFSSLRTSFWSGGEKVSPTPKNVVYTVHINHFVDNDQMQKDKYVNKTPPWPQT